MLTWRKRSRLSNKTEERTVDDLFGLGVGDLIVEKAQRAHKLCVMWLRLAGLKCRGAYETEWLHEIKQSRGRATRKVQAHLRGAELGIRHAVFDELQVCNSGLDFIQLLRSHARGVLEFGSAQQCAGGRLQTILFEVRLTCNVVGRAQIRC